MIDFVSLSISTCEISISKFLIRIDGRIRRRLPSSRYFDRVASRKSPTWSLRAAYRGDFKPDNSRKRLIRSSSLNRSADSGDKEANRYSPSDDFVETRSGNGEAKQNLVSESDKEEERDGDEALPPLSFDFLKLKRELEKEEAVSSTGGVEDHDLVPPGGVGSTALDSAEAGGLVGQVGVKSRKQMMKRSNLLAKQVISIQSAQSLGFVSQLWVNTRSWMVVLVEVRPNLLSGEMEKLLLEDVKQVGDVVLVEDENVMENELKMIGLDTLVGYSVVTSGRRNVGKVRGYTFNINSGAVESLELDSFGFSIIPASLVSTYCLLIEDVLNVVSETVIVHEGAVSRVQRLTKGIWDAQSSDMTRDDIGEYPEFGRKDSTSYDRNSRKDSSGRKFRWRRKEREDDWELPIDY